MTISSKNSNKDSTNNNNTNKVDSSSSSKNKENQQLVGGKNKNNDPKSKLSSAAQRGESTNTNEEDKYKKFENGGVVFKAKLIGSELVMEPRGDKMCQNSIQRLKAIIKGTNSHKRRIVLKISFDGVKVYDEKTNEILHHHEVSQISYIASDDTDNRSFGYVSDVPNKAHQFICFKTSGPAITVMSVISALFEAVLEKKNEAEREKEKEKEKEREKEKSGKEQSSFPSATTTEPTFKQSSITSHFDDLVVDGEVKNIDNILTVGNNFSDDLDGVIVSNAMNNNNIMNASNTNKVLKTSSTLLDSVQESIDLIGDSGIIDEDVSIFSDIHAKLSASSPQTSQHRHQQAASSSGFGGAGGAPPLPIPERQSQHAVFLPPPSSLPKPAPMMHHHFAGPSHNRSLVYNHSSVSLSDAALTRQPSFTATNSSLNDSCVDKYAVFNDIDSLPSIFESASLGSVNKINEFQQNPLQNPQQDPVQQQHQQFSQSQHLPFPQYPPLIYQQQQQLQPQFQQQTNPILIPQSSLNHVSNAFSNPNSSAPSSNATGKPQMMSSTLPNQLTNPFDDDFFA